MHDKISPHLFVTELRTIAADKLWMSMAYERKSLATIPFHVVEAPEWPDVEKLVLPLIEAALKPFAPRPHWGKLFTLDEAQLAPCYTRLEEFRKLMSHYDPKGKLRNRFINTNLYAS